MSWIKAIASSDAVGINFFNEIGEAAGNLNPILSASLNPLGQFSLVGVPRT